MADLTTEEKAQIAVFVHMWEHARARKGIGLPEAETVHLCWDYPMDEPPTWAVEAAEAGEPSATWCPVLNPQLWNTR
jgi:hypothetical protein